MKSYSFPNYFCFFSRKGFTEFNEVQIFPSSDWAELLQREVGLRQRGEADRKCEVDLTEQGRVEGWRMVGRSRRRD